MLSLSFSPKLVKPKIQKKLAQIKKTAAPDFATHKIDLVGLGKTIKKYRRFKKLILIGSGGSKNNTLAMYQALRNFRADKPVAFLDTPEPGLIDWIKKHFKPAETLVMPVSKSGTNIDTLAPLSAFWDYKILPVTGFKNSVLHEMAKKRGWEVIEHPEVGGRFSGRTSCAFAPLSFLEMDVQEIDRGAKAMYQKCAPAVPLNKNPALQTAVYLHHFDLHGYDEIFASIYSSKVVGFLPLMIQLIHESTGKDGKGQTIFGDLGPENQHHTVQRFFGGRKNVIGWYLLIKNLEDPDLKIKVPKDFQNISLRNSHLKMYHNMPLARALEIDHQSNIADARQRSIPHVVLTIDRVTPYTMGEFLAFLQYLAVYSALLRDQNPFDQPEVERYKEISFRMAKQEAKTEG